MNEKTIRAFATKIAQTVYGQEAHANKIYSEAGFRITRSKEAKHLGKGVLHIVNQDTSIYSMREITRIANDLAPDHGYTMVHVADDEYKGSVSDQMVRFVEVGEQVSSNDEVADVEPVKPNETGDGQGDATSDEVAYANHNGIQRGFMLTMFNETRTNLIKEQHGCRIRTTTREKSLGDYVYELSVAENYDGTLTEFVGIFQTYLTNADRAIATGNTELVVLDWEDYQESKHDIEAQAKEIGGWRKVIVKFC